MIVGIGHWSSAEFGIKCQPILIRTTGLPDYSNELTDLLQTKKVNIRSGLCSLETSLSDRTNN